MKIAVCGTSYFDKRLCGNIEFVCKKHYRTVKLQNEFEHDCDIVFISDVDNAREIRRINKNVPIILLCEKSEDALVGYDIRALSCIRPPFLRKRIEAAMFDDSA